MYRNKSDITLPSLNVQKQGDYKRKEQRNNSSYNQYDPNNMYYNNSELYKNNNNTKKNKEIVDSQFWDEEPIQSNYKNNNPQLKEYNDLFGNNSTLQKPKPQRKIYIEALEQNQADPHNLQQIEAIKAKH